MPNGDEHTPGEWAQVRAAFDKIGPALEAFAQHNGLAIECYYHHMPVWSLQFRRRIGGQAVIEVACKFAAPVEFRVTSLWWYDDPRDGMRYGKTMKPSLLFRSDSEPAHIEGLLSRALAVIDSWLPGEWDDRSGPHWSGPTSESEGTAGARRFPLR